MGGRLLLYNGSFNEVKSLTLAQLLKYLESAEDKTERLWNYFVKYNIDAISIIKRSIFVFNLCREWIVMNWFSFADLGVFQNILYYFVIGLACINLLINDGWWKFVNSFDDIDRAAT